MSTVTHSLTEVADMLGFARGESGAAGYLRVYRMVKSGELRAVKFAGKYRVTDDALREFLSGAVVAS